MGRLKLLLLLLLLISINVPAQQGAGTAASIYRTTFANLGTPVDGSVRYVTDGTPNTAPCTGGGSGAFAQRTAGVWVCGSSSGSGISGAGTANQVVKYTGAATVGNSGIQDTGTTTTVKLTETPPAASTTALAGAGAGNVDNGAHTVWVTCATAGGQTSQGTASNITTVADKTVNGKIAITNIPLCSTVATGRDVYMSTVAAPTVPKLLSNGIISDNTTTTLTANDSDATLAASTTAPASNTAIDARLTVQQSQVVAGTTVASPISPLLVNESKRQTAFTGTGNGGLSLIGTSNTGDYLTLNFISGSQLPLAKIASEQTAAGSRIDVGTSNSFGSGITNKSVLVDESGTVFAKSTPVGIYNFNQTAQSQVTVSGTEYYITNSNLNMPAAYTTAIAAGTTMHWRIALTKSAAGTGTFQILLKKGTNGSTADTSIVTQTIGTQTAAADNMEVDISLTWTSATAAYWTIIPHQSAATGTGFGLVYPAQAAQFTGTIAGQTTTTVNDKYGLSVIFTTGTPTFVVNMVQANAYGVN